MKLDLYHNKIISDTITPEFEESVSRLLLPLLKERFGEIEEIQMYEDYISDNLIYDGFCYYPLSVVIGGIPTTQWIRWPYNRSEFEDGIPYSYIGSILLPFDLCEAPEAFEKAIEGRARYCEDGVIKLHVDTVGGDPLVLSGRYSQTFIDEMARQLTSEIEAATGVDGIADSSVELEMVFASGTFMEHTSDNVTYRRLRLRDKVSAPRDFWVKWTRLDGALGYSVSDHVTAENIKFELGEDVEQKIREKEYRYLLSSGKEKYHNAMGRKKVTEWREVIKRAAKRGELIRNETDFELTPETLELEERIAGLLGKKPAERVGYEKAEIPFLHSDGGEFELALEKMKMIVDSVSEQDDIDDGLAFEEEILSFVSDETEAVVFDEKQPEIEEIHEEKVIENIEDIVDEEEDIEDELVFEEEADEDEEIEDIEEPDEDEPVEESDEEDEFEIEDETEEIEEELEEEIEEILPDEQTEEEISEEIDEVEEEIVDEEESVEIPVENIEIQPEDKPEEKPEDKSEEKKPSTPLADRAADIRAEIETKIRLEYETRARAKAEAELVILRRENQRLRLKIEAIISAAKQEEERLRFEYERLLEETARKEAQREADEAQRLAEEAELRAQIEAQLRAEAQERERLAESARMAIEEQHRLEAENARIARQREEELRAEEEARRKEEEERELEALRQAELERIRREDEEAKARARAAMPEMGDGNYSYTSKTVRLLFRRSVDPNITTRIYEIIKATVDYYGKDRVYLKIRASVPDSQTVILEFENIPIEEMSLLGNIIKILGNSGLGIGKAIIE